MLDTTGSDTVHYSYDSRGQLVSFKLNGTPYFYTRNGQSDITGLIDASGVEVVKYTYDSWGKPISITGSLALTVGAKNPYRYRGYRYDQESGLYYLQSRYYDPSIKRFISADIFVSTGQGFSGNNVYAYCGNQPINRSDSGGMFWETAFDVVSLGFSIWEVVQNPKDPWAWAGLVGDAIDLLPIVTGVGETTRAIKTANNLAETADNAVDAIKGGTATTNKAPDFVVTPNGDAIPIPKGASGPVDVVNPTGKTTGFSYTGGSSGANGQVSSVRIMDPTPPRGNSPGYPNGYVKYENNRLQGVDPFSGWTLPNSQSHFPLK